MADVVFNSFHRDLGLGLIDLLNNEIRVAIMTDQFVPDKDTMENWTHVNNEASGEGYTSGGQALQNKSLTKDDVNDLAKWDADDPFWDPVTLINARWALYYKGAAAAADRLLIMAKDFGANQSPNNVKFIIQHHSNGISRIREYGV